MASGDEMVLTQKKLNDIKSCSHDIVQGAMAMANVFANRGLIKVKPKELLNLQDRLEVEVLLWFTETDKSDE